MLDRVIEDQVKDMAQASRRIFHFDSAHLLLDQDDFAVPCREANPETQGILAGAELDNGVGKFLIQPINPSYELAEIHDAPLLCGAGDRHRTCDLRITSALLCHLSYAG